MNPLDEKKLAERAAAGDVKAFGDLVKATEQKLFSFAVSICGGNRDTAEEIYQEALTKAFVNIGGFEGRALRAGDVIGLRHPEKGQQDLSWRWVPERQLSVPTDSGITKVRVIPGPQEEMFTEEGIRTFYESAYEISSHSDRMGFRLSGPAVASKNGYDILSDGIVNGSVQISGTGEPIVMMADRQTTGGYAKIASLIDVDIPLFAQLRPGRKVQFEKCTVEEAQRLMREADKAWKEHCRSLKEGGPSRNLAEASETASQGSGVPAAGLQSITVQKLRSADNGSRRTGWRRGQWNNSRKGGRR